LGSDRRGGDVPSGSSPLEQAAAEIENEILATISKSEVPEDLEHARDTRAWLLRLKPDADAALQIAALGHDIERSIRERKVKRSYFRDYDAFKRAHAENSAAILKEILMKYDLDREWIDRVIDLVRRHETGGTPDADILKDADSLSFFRVNLPLYFLRHTPEETTFRIRWGYARLSPRARSLVNTFRYQDPQLQTLFETALTPHS